MNDIIFQTKPEDAALIEDDIKCKVCSKKFKEPYLLPCEHSYCKECIEKLEKVRDNEFNFYNCPANCKDATRPLLKEHYGVIRNYSVASIVKKINKVCIIANTLVK